ncbi:uncharacterized protein [Diadema antillarum]|uniref:uncharacterized protein n=1 Tax=Diadema antillarum TaxID=105358 RepID=UPI003A851043
MCECVLPFHGLSGQCFMCPAGVPGPRGPPGPAGVAGRDGRDGRDAPIDLQVVDESPEPVEESEETISAGEETRCDNKTNGALYVRWGKPDCPQGAKLVYSGSVGGELYTHAGGTSNYLCLPDQPIYDEVETVAHGWRGLVFSAEFETHSFVGHWQELADQTPTCAVCLAPCGRTTKLVIPARNECPSDDWRLEYAGYLMSSAIVHHRTEYICVDRHAETVPGTHGNQNGALLYLVEGRCMHGSGLPCGPYVNGFELTCAVCTI